MAFNRGRRVHAGAAAGGVYVCPRIVGATPRDRAPNPKCVRRRRRELAPSCCCCCGSPGPRRRSLSLSLARAQSLNRPSDAPGLRRIRLLDGLEPKASYCPASERLFAPPTCMCIRVYEGENGCVSVRGSPKSWVRKLQPRRRRRRFFFRAPLHTRVPVYLSPTRDLHSSFFFVFFLPRPLSLPRELTRATIMRALPPAPAAESIREEVVRGNLWRR